MLQEVHPTSTKVPSITLTGFVFEKTVLLTGDGPNSAQCDTEALDLNRAAQKKSQIYFTHIQIV